MKKKNKSKVSIKKELLAGFSLLLIGLLLILGMYQYKSLKKYLYNNRLEYLDSRFQNINGRFIIKCNTEGLLLASSEMFLNDVIGENVCAAIIDSQGNIINEKSSSQGITTEISKGKETIPMVPPKLTNEEYKKILEKKELDSGSRVVKDEEGKEQLVIFRKIGRIDNPIGLIQISTSLHPTTELLHAQAMTIFISVMATIIIGIILGWRFLIATLKPLACMTDTLDKVDKNQLGIRLDNQTRQLEVDNLADKFNSMFQRLETAFEQEKQNNERMRNFVLDASHELRTPLTSIQGFIEVLQMGAAKDKQQLNMALDSMMTESKRLNKLVHNLLQLIKLEEKDTFEKKKENIDQILNEIKPNLELLCKKRNLTIELHCNYFCNVNKDQMKQVIFNLTQNAMNHTKEDGSITIKTNDEEKDGQECIKLSVKDNGEGISDENQALIFDRFYRVEKHRSRKNGGCGLGLSIVKSIVDNHDGIIELESKIGEGSEFMIWIPCK